MNLTCLIHTVSNFCQKAIFICLWASKCKSFQFHNAFPLPPDQGSSGFTILPERPSPTYSWLRAYETSFIDKTANKNRLTILRQVVDEYASAGARNFTSHYISGCMEKCEIRNRSRTQLVGANLLSTQLQLGQRNRQTDHRIAHPKT